MRRPAVPLCILGFALLGVTSNVLGQALPSTAPTTPAPTGARAVPAQLPPERAARRAQVAYRAGTLEVIADNSSLNQILREIGHVTGMKITGGVMDERVFGSYGPADPSRVLAALLDGTGSNMMLTLNSARVPAELVLTPRQGGPTPPDPNAGNFANTGDDLPPERRLGMPQPPATPARASVPVQTPGSTAPQPATGTPASTSTGSDTTTQESPNGVKTPQQIYDQLIKMQQQQPKNTPPQ